jgi:hypothetical protein
MFSLGAMGRAAVVVHDPLVQPIYQATSTYIKLEFGLLVEGGGYGLVRNSGFRKVWEGGVVSATCGTGGVKL